MFEYFSEIKNRDEFAKKRFVIVGTAISFIAIIGVWVPIRIAQWRTPGDATVAKTEETAPLTTATPAVAGDSAIRIFTNVASPKPTVAPVFITQPEAPLFAQPVVSVTPTSVPTATAEALFETEAPTPTDFPTL
ncbi:MAG: hypothetical protein Q7S57_00120 [bacterium]|nr:hypothetical protein [bacterium]